jgi:hypothetical protein
MSVLIRTRSFCLCFSENFADTILYASKCLHNTYNMVCASLPVCWHDVAAYFIYSNHLHIYLRWQFYWLTVAQVVQDLESCLTIHLCFMPKFRLLAAASAPTYLSMAGCSRTRTSHVSSSYLSSSSCTSSFASSCVPYFFFFFFFLLLLFIVIKYRSSKVGRDSVVSVATRYGVGGPGIECQWGRDFAGPGAHPSSSKWVPSLFPGGKAIGTWRWTPSAI